MPTPLETRVETRRFVFPAQANARGTAHGGYLLLWAEQLAAMSAMRFAGTDVVTVGLDDVTLSGPIPEGSIALLEAYVYRAGESSVTVRVDGFEEDRHTGDRRGVIEATVTLVAVDGDGEPVDVPALVVEHERDERLVAAAEGDGSAE
jgi:acyl-CoA hydrolase